MLIRALVKYLVFKKKQTSQPGLITEAETFKIKHI